MNNIPRAQLVHIFCNTNKVIAEGSFPLMQFLKNEKQKAYRGKGLLQIRKVRTKCTACKGTGEASAQFPGKCKTCRGMGKV